MSIYEASMWGILSVTTIFIVVKEWNRYKLNKWLDKQDEETQTLYRYDGTQWKECKLVWPDGKGFECSSHFGEMKGRFDPGNFGDQEHTEVLNEE